MSTLSHSEQTSQAPFLTIDEVASGWKVSAMTVRRIVHRGELRAVRIGDQLRVSQSDLDDYVERQRTGATAE